MKQKNKFSVDSATHEADVLHFIETGKPDLLSLEKELYPIRSSFDSLDRVLDDFVKATVTHLAREFQDSLISSGLADCPITEGEDQEEIEKRVFSNQKDDCSEIMLVLSRNAVARENEIKEIRLLANELRNRFEKLAKSLNFDIGGGRIINSGKNLAFSVNVSSAMLNNSMLTVTTAVKDNLLNVGDEIEVVLPWGESFKTEIVSPGNRLRERSKIRELFQREKVEPLDNALFSFVEGKWHVEIVKSFASMVGKETI